MKDMNEALRHELHELEKAGDILEYSYNKCNTIGIKPGLSNDQLESFEALTSRFARLSDIIIQKILRYFDILDLEEKGTVRDRINRAEKKQVIESADDFIQIRILRNEIAHEYQSETIYSIFEKVVELTPILLKSIDSLTAYAHKYQISHGRLLKNISTGLVETAGFPIAKEVNRGDFSRTGTEALQL